MNVHFSATTTSRDECTFDGNLYNAFHQLFARAKHRVSALMSPVSGTPNTMMEPPHSAVPTFVCTTMVDTWQRLQTPSAAHVFIYLFLYLKCPRGIIWRHLGIIWIMSPQQSETTIAAGSTLSTYSQTNSSSQSTVSNQDPTLFKNAHTIRSRFRANRRDLLRTVPLTNCPVQKGFCFYQNVVVPLPVTVVPLMSGAEIIAASGSNNAIWRRPIDLYFLPENDAKWNKGSRIRQSASYLTRGRQSIRYTDGFSNPKLLQWGFLRVH